MEKPHIPDAPGLVWRPRKNAWAAVWVARADIRERGFEPATSQLAVFTAPPTEQEETAVRTVCVRLQEEMYEFGSTKPKPFDGSLRALIFGFQKDPDSGYAKLEWSTRATLDRELRHINTDHGHLMLADLNAREFLRIYNGYRWKNGIDDGTPGKVALSYQRMGTIRRLMKYGAVFEVDPNCRRLKEMLSDMAFENPKAREKSMTLRQCEDVIAAAHQEGFPSIALAQALQFDLRLRQRDVIGVWVPVAEHGISVIGPHLGRKWLRGMRHEEISSTMNISHPISKSRRYGKVLERDLRLYPMVMAELDRIPEEKRKGPLVVCELTGRPWRGNTFRMHWRKIATKAGIPSDVWNMDNRASGISETIEATNGNVEAARKEAEHTDIKTTLRYSRRKKQSNDATAVIVADFRAKNKG